MKIPSPYDVIGSDEFWENATNAFLWCLLLFLVASGVFGVAHVAQAVLS